MTRYVVDDNDTDDAGSSAATAQLDASVTESLGSGQYTVRINGGDRPLRVISADSKSMEFLLDGAHHKVRYVSRTTRDISMVIDGVPVSLGTHAELDAIVYKNSGGAAAAGRGAAASTTSLKSQIPGKVVSISVSEGDVVAKGDVICTLESMKMQVGVKAHKAGTVSSISVAESDTVAKGDIIAEIE